MGLAVSFIKANLSVVRRFIRVSHEGESGVLWWCIYVRCGVVWCAWWCGVHGVVVCCELCCGVLYCTVVCDVHLYSGVWCAVYV